MKYHFKKDVYVSLRAIEHLHQETPYKTVLKDFYLDDCIATSQKKENGGFKIKFFLDKFISNINDDEKSGIKENINLKNGNSVYYINKGSVRAISRQLSSPSILSINVDNFQRGRNNEYDNKKIRLIIPCEVEPTFEVLEAKSVHISDTTYFWGLLEVTVNGKNYHVFKYVNDDTKKKYLIIDALETNKFQEFKNNTESIILGYGYVNGDLFRGEYYYHVDNRKSKNKSDLIAYYKKEDSIITGASLFNPREFIQYLEYLKKSELLEKINPQLSNEYFSRIVEKISSNSTFARCVDLLINANNSKVLLLRAGIYSISLETLTNIIYEENEERINPISDKNLAEKIQKKLNNVVEEYDVFLTDYGRQIIDAKINDLNRPTNSKKLSKPFEIYGIKLSKNDIKILNHRNKFLHGSAPFEEDQLKQKEVELAYISSKLFSLINMLALKYCGYSGHLYDHGSFHQLYWEEKVTEPLFKII